MEVFRGLAALYVLFHHTRELLPKKIVFLFQFGQEAVILFFLLSGFVIHYSYCARNKAFRIDHFLTRRALRIYPALFASFILTLIIALIKKDFQNCSPVILIANIAGLQESQIQKPGVGFPTFGNNDPLWSLGYEIWFYIFYAFVARLTFNKKLAFVIFFSALSTVLFSYSPGKTFLNLMYLPLWWLGACLSEYYAYNKLTAVYKGLLISIFTITIYIFLNFNGIITSSHTIGLHPLIEIRHFFTGIFFCVVWLLMLKFLNNDNFLFLRPISIIAQISYGLYIMHYPIIGYIKFLGLPDSISVFLILLMSLLFAYAIEVKFQPWLLKKIIK